MKKAIHFLIDYWHVPAFIAGAVLVWVVWNLTGGKKAPPVGTIARELEAIRAGSAARELLLKLGKEQAAAQLRKDKAAEIEALDAKHAARAKELEHDPVALSRLLVRAGKRHT